MPIFHNDDTVSPIALMSDAERREWYEMMTPEGRVKAKVKKELADMGAYQFWPVQTGYGAATVDCLACVYQREFWGIETKAPGKKPTPRQLTTMKQIRKAGGRAWWVTMDERGELVWHEVID